MASASVPAEFFTNLGPSGLKISRIIVGCMTFGKKYWSDWVIEDKEKVFAIMKKCYDSGLRTFDTADTYSNGYSEVLLREFMEKYNIQRDKIVILTKLFYPVEPDVPGFSAAARNQFPVYEFVNSQGLSRKHIMDAAKGSNERLGTYADVIQIHRFDPSTPIEETMEALHDIVKLGYTRYIGASTMRTYQFVMMQNVAEKHGWTKFISMQNYYNLLYREEEEEMMEYCKLTNVGVIPWSPNARGVLTRPHGATGETNRTAADAHRMKKLGLDVLGDGDQEILLRVEEVAKKHGVSMAVVSTAYVLSKGYSPIVGFSKPERVDDAVEAFSFYKKLTPEETAYLEEPYTPKKWTC
ncbi:hypothetical protein PICMEDRAFT_72971 [Pichia membranifaciens NRRL Y-2026]|uniref:NADP-dependent oxidoreductase domain-containing protein n=1 Tax=Pichia membranifaciens NRRL Y-2026 TaxID=763406 RepID=A0A1E3NLC7_9ASCO|nr:hypothetical protein PICMEDRAFT_72971 [Pichia membranifaciens NRRL Y-2026]ODQ46952.1 hypothetical protein PICMEDRAFT_72971 [Pichia membranifaciens NRRL Y-2026]